MEDCCPLTVTKLRDVGVLHSPVGTTFTVNWSDSSGRELFRADVWLVPGPGGAIMLRLRYEARDLETRKKGGLISTVQVVKTECRFGGLRYWFVCPLVRQTGLFCRKRVHTLFLPPGAHYWGCRGCQNLVYRSAKEHDSRVNRLAADPEAYLDALRSGSVTQLALAMRAGKLVCERLRRRSGKFCDLARGWEHALEVIALSRGSNVAEERKIASV